MNAVAKGERVMWQGAEFDGRYGRITISHTGVVQGVDGRAVIVVSDTTRTTYCVDQDRLKKNVR